MVSCSPVRNCDCASQPPSSVNFAIVSFQVATSAYLWVIVFLDPIANYVYGPDIVWNTAAITIVTIQVLVTVSVVAATVLIQNGKRDFI